MRLCDRWQCCWGRQSLQHYYDQRRQVLVRALKESFGSRVTIPGENGGIHLMASIETTLSDDDVIQRAASVDVGVVSARDYYLTTPTSSEFIFGYAQLTEAQIEHGI